MTTYIGYRHCRICGCVTRGTICPDCSEIKAESWPDEDAEYERERDLRAERECAR